MKAAVIFQRNGLPQYIDLSEPVSNGENERIASVKAVAIKHIDKSRATGKHYSGSMPDAPGKIIGSDGVCILADGRRVYAIGMAGMLAEKAVVDVERMTDVPDALSDSIAAALPNAVIGSVMALKFKAAIKPGDVVLINGATGFTGRVAVQVAKLYGASKVIATGRNKQSLEELRACGADEIISLLQEDEKIKADIIRIHKTKQVDIIIDYLWGHSAEMILQCLQGDGRFTNFTRFVSVGSVTGDEISLSSATLRSANLQLSGSGLGAWTKDQVRELFTDILPQMFAWAAEGRLVIKTVEVKLKDIGALWDLVIPDGHRLVVMVDER